MKELYEAPELEIITFGEVRDLIMTSGGGGGGTCGCYDDWHGQEVFDT